MNRSAEFFVVIVIILLVIAGVLAFAFGIPSAIAPTTTVSTTTQSTENNVTNNSTTTTPTNTSTTYTDPGHVFSFSYPSAFTLSGGTMGYSTDWMEGTQELGRALVKVVVSQSFEPKTNFVDARFTVGTSSSTKAISGCLTAPESGSPVQKSTVTIHGTTFTKFISSDAGAGNFYETTSYRAVHDGQCYAVEYTIHTSNIANYPPNSGITEFNHSTVVNALEGIVQSFTFTS